VKTFTFSFRSADKPGMFFEEWELITDPQLLQQLPLIYLSGISTLNDDKRQNLIQAKKAKVEGEIKDNIVKEQLQDILDQVKEPEKPKPDIRDPQTFVKAFEENNRHIGVYFSQSIMNQLFELL
jgi:MYCBP-associated protein family